MGGGMGFDPICSDNIEGVVFKKIDDFLPKIVFNSGAFTSDEKLQKEHFKAFGKNAAKHFKCRSFADFRTVVCSMDDFVLHDIPAAVAHVTGATGTDAVSWVGHSLGGTIILPYMAENPSRVRSAVLLSSPSFAHLAEGLLWRAVRDLGFLARLVSVVPVSTANRILSPLLYAAGVPLKRAVGWPEWENVENMPSERIGKVYRVGSSDVSRGMVFHAARRIRARRFVSADGTTDYSALSGRIREPVLVIRGEADRIVPQSDVEWGFEQVGSPTKRIVTVGRSSGGRADYGHVDLLFGDQAPEEVYPLIAGWLEDHAESGPAE